MPSGILSNKTWYFSLKAWNKPENILNLKYDIDRNLTSDGKGTYEYDAFGNVVQSEEKIRNLSQDIETAQNVGQRHDDKPYILVIDALKAWNDGISFYYGNEKVWLADFVPRIYIKEL